MIIGIDPGKHGGICALSDNARFGIVWDMPLVEVKKGKLIKTHIDRGELLEILNEACIEAIDRKEQVFVITENQQPYPNQGSVSNFSTGFGFGCILMALDAKNLSYETVHPKTWQKHFAISKDTKGQSCQVAERLFPDLSFRTKRGKALDGRADAALMAEWARRRRNGLST